MPRAEPLEIDLALDDLAAVYGERLSDRVNALYRQALDDLSVGELAAAVDWLLRNHERYFPTPAEIRKAAFAARPELPALPPPEHRLFLADNDDRSPEEIIAERVALAPCWAELRRVLAERGRELAAPRRLDGTFAAANDDEFRPSRALAAIAAELRATFRLPDADDPAVQHWLVEMAGNPPVPANDDPADTGEKPEL